MRTLDQALAQARERYVAARPTSQRMAAAAGAVMPGANTRSVLHVEPFAARVDRVDGAVLVDVDGNRAVDLLGDYSAGLLGHGHPAVAGALRRVLDDGWSFGAMTAGEATLATALTSRFPAIERIRFTNSGTEANLMAVQVARQATGRDLVVVFDGAYHGGVLTFSESGRAMRVPFETLVGRYNDTADLARLVRDHGTRIAAVLVEPMMGAGGCLPADPAFLRTARELTTDVGALLVFDEVMTSRMGPGGAHGLLDITPDLVTLGKYLAGGLSFGAFGGRADLMAMFDPAEGGVGHGGTFNNNAFTMAAGIAVDDVLDAGRVLPDLAARGDALRAALAAVLERAPTPMSVTGWGSFGCFHPVAGPVASVDDLRDADQRWRDLLHLELLERGMRIAARGYWALSLTVTDAHLDDFVRAVDTIVSGWSDIA